MHPTRLTALLQELGEAVREMTDILRAEVPDRASYWEQVAAEIAHLRTDGTPREAEQFARRTSHTFGSGMGSFGDISINDRFDMLRDTVGTLLGRIEDAARIVDGVDRARVRTALVNLETVFLEAGMADATRLREIFTRDELDYEGVREIMRDLRRKEPQWPTHHRAAIGSLLDQLSSELAKASHS